MKKENKPRVALEIAFIMISLFGGLFLSGFVQIIFIKLPFVFAWLLGALIVRLIIFTICNSKAFKQMEEK
jgi:hypothetical protein